MEKESVMSVAQLLSSMREVLDRMEEAQKKNDSEKMNAAKREILNLQKQIARLI